MRTPNASESEPPIRFADDPDKTLQQTLASYRTAAPLTAAHFAGKLQLAHGYDVSHMDRAVAILFWGRSGSLLLSSYLDGHDETLVMPALTSGLVYKLFAKYPRLSVWEKLIAYPTNFELTFAGTSASSTSSSAAAFRSTPPNTTPPSTRSISSTTGATPPSSSYGARSFNCCL